MTLGFRKVVTNQNSLESLYKENSIWLSNLYIKEGLLSLILIPLYFIGKIIEIIERPAVGSIINTFVDVSFILCPYVFLGI